MKSTTPDRRAISRFRSLSLPASIAGIGLFLLPVSGAQAQGIHVTLNGENVPFQGIGPQQIEGRVLVPVRGILEKLGANIAWVPQSQTVIASNGKVDIQLKIGQRNATVNGRNVTLDVPAQVLSGSTMVPLRFLGEALGADIKWDSSSRTVVMQTQGGTKTPAAENPQNNNNRPVITQLNHNGGAWLRANTTFRATMVGTPGGEATFRIPGVVDAVPMRELSPGRYTGEWRVPADKGTPLADASVIGSLKVGSREAPLLQAKQNVSLDGIGPRVRDRAPEPNTTATNNRPNIYAVFEDKGSGVNPASIKLLFNGQDVTARANVTKDFISYTPSENLPGGAQTVQLTLADKAGNQTQTTWKFNHQTTSSEIKAVTHNAQSRLEAGDTLHVEATGTPGASRAVFNVGSNLRNLRMTEDQPGHYTGDYTIKKGDDANNARVRVYLVLNGQRYAADAAKPVTIGTGKPVEPTITYPTASDSPANPLVVRGKAAPNSRVRIKVDYKNSVLGILALQGTAADTIIDVDKDGNWQTSPINLSGLFSNRNVDYTIQATAINGAEETSEPAELRFRVR